MTANELCWSDFHGSFLHSGKSHNELFGELLAGQCDVVLVDGDGLPHRLVQLVPLIVSANEIVRCREKVALLEGLNDEGDCPSRLPVGGRHSFHEFGGHDGLKVCAFGARRDHRKHGLASVSDWRPRDVLQGGGDGSERVTRGGSTVTDALSAKARKPSQGLEGLICIAITRRLEGWASRGR